MIIFNNKENKLIKNEYPRIYKYIEGFILRHKKELPVWLKVKIYDYENGRDTSTGLCYKINCQTGRETNWELDINLKQIFRLYKENDFYLSGRNYPAKVKGIRKYILFVIYHEFGHYNLEHSKKFAGFDRTGAENDCDLWAFNKLSQGQAEFDFKPGIKEVIK